MRYAPVREVGRILAALAVATAAPAQLRGQFAEVAPYRDIEWPDGTSGTPRVLLDEGWFELLSIDGATIGDITSHARSEYGSDWLKRFEEDLVEVLSTMGAPPGATVTLGLRDPETGHALTRTAEMTADNRRAIMAAGRLASVPARALAFLRGRLPPDAVLSGEEISLDLDALQATLEARFAYLRATAVDYRGAIAALRRRAANGMTHTDYGVEVRRIVSMFIDGHASVSVFHIPDPDLPFFVESSARGFVAVRPDRTAFLDPDHPVVTHIDGRAVSDWLAAAGPYVPKGSPQFRRWRSLGLIRRARFMRPLMGLPPSDSVSVDVASLSGEDVGRLGVTLPDSVALPVRWPRAGSGIIDGNVGYLRLASMDEAAAAAVDAFMPRFRETRGLVVDVRGNTGGSRDALRALFPYLTTENDPPRVVNAARYRLSPDFDDDHLSNRRLYRESWSGWTPDERAAIAGFRESFEPEWTPPEDEFSEWHYMVLSRRDNPAAFAYGRPVVVLMDEHCFSATDIFLSALKGWHGVTLVGSPSGGGSARGVSAWLPASGLRLNLASMASFQRDGRLYDGNGIDPDVLVFPEPEYFLAGGRDNVLERALELLP